MAAVAAGTSRHGVGRSDMRTSGMVGLPPQTQNANPCLKGSGPFASNIFFGASPIRQRRETVEHPFGTIKMRMGATHFLMKRLPKVRGEMALHVLAYNLTRVLNILGIQPLMAVLRA